MACKHLPMLLQAEAAECGLACLAMISSFHKHRVDLNELRHRFRVTLKGTTMRELTGFARALGLTPRALRLEPSALSRLQLPAMLHFDMNHFVVLKEMRGADAVIHDPATGVRRVPASEMGRRFTGVALELVPSEGFEERHAAPSLTLRRFAGEAGETRPILAKALLLSALLQILVLATPLYVQLAIDRSVTQGNADALLPLAAGLALILLLRGGFALLRNEVLLAFNGLFNARVTGNVVRHMLRLPNRWFENRYVGGILSRVSSTQPIRELIAEGLVGAVVDGLMAALTIALAALFAPKLALIVLAGFAMTALVKWLQVRASMDREHEYVEALAKAQQELIETVRGITSIKLAAKEGDRELRWIDRNVEAINARYALDRIRGGADIARDLVQGAVVGLIVYAGALDVISGRTTLGVLMAFIAYQQMFAVSAAKLVDFAGRARLLQVHLQRLADVMLAEPEETGAAQLLSDEDGARLAGGVSVRGLAFRFSPAEQDLFADLSLDIAPGEFVAITGASGAGKTTLLKILLGLLQPTAGSVLYDGRPLAAIGNLNMRRDIGAVMQDDVLLSGSLAQNISFFDAQPDMRRIEEAARTAAIHDVIAGLPMGYNSFVGDMGTMLSGGQRQRVLLARALYRRPAILFMDEGTSSLDTDREREVNANLRELKMTRIIIAHRKDTIDAAGRRLELTQAGLKLIA